MLAFRVWLSSVAASAVLSDASGLAGLSLSSSLSRFSRPFTRVSKASSTSVLGPRFFGIASMRAVRSTAESVVT